ncbi:MAG: hypothetical protein JNM86_14260 [Phycisphaerae bacterium]|nr:hypothetical protein [Phycisphaerae bacterium]
MFRTVSVVVVALCICTMADAGWIATARTSTIIANGDGNTGTLSDTSMNAFDQSIARTGQNGSASVRQQSSLTSNGMAYFTRAGIGSWSGGHGTWGNGRAFSEFSVTYTLSTATNYVMNVTKYFPPSAFRFQIKNLTTNTNVYYNGSIEDGSFSTSGTLGAGQYQVSIILDFQGGAGFNMTSDATASFSFIPTPSVLATFALGGIATLRRRR